MKQRYNYTTAQDEHNEAVERFMVELIALCTRHELWLSHEDRQGAFIVTPTSTQEWLEEASMEEV